LTAEALEAVTLWRETFGPIRAAYPQAGFRIWRHQVKRTLINAFVSDLIETILARVRDQHLDSLEAIRATGEPIATFSDAMEAKRLELKAFLMEHLYRHYRVMRMAVKAQRIMSDLFRAYMAEPAQLPPHIAARWQAGEPQPRVIADYVAGMTDRFAVDEHKKLFDPEARV